MLKKIKLPPIAIFSIIVVLFLSFPASSFATKFYTQDKIKITARINEDGSLSVEETRTYNFRGSFSWADYSLPLRDLGQVTEFSLSEGDKIYQQSDTQQPGTYFISQTKRKFYVKWFYRANDEIRSFTLRYKVANTVNVYSDVAEFYYKFVSANKPKEIRKVEVDLYFPQYADTTQVRAWLHTALNGTYYFADGKIHFEVTALPTDKFFEVRAIFPPSWVPFATKKINQARRSYILAEEKGFAEKANKLRQKLQKEEELRKTYAPKMKNYSLLAILLGVILYFQLYSRYGKAHQVPGLARVSSEIPENLTPAQANFFLMNGQIGGGALTGTLIDLAARGYLKIDEKVEDSKILFFKLKKKNADSAP